jgi:hypothetical protein
MRKGGEPADDRGDALNEDLSRILLGEFLLCGAPPDGPPAPSEEVLRQARPLLDELARIARELEGSTEHTADGVKAEARRIRHIVAVLADLLTPSRVGRAAA